MHGRTSGLSLRSKQRADRLERQSRDVSRQIYRKALAFFDSVETTPFGLYPVGTFVYIPPKVLDGVSIIRAAR